MRQSKKYKENKNQSIQNIVNHAQGDTDLKAQVEEKQSVKMKVPEKGQDLVKKNNLS